MMVSLSLHAWVYVSVVNKPVVNKPLWYLLFLLRTNLYGICCFCCEQMDMIFRSEMTIFNRNAGFMTCLIDPMVCQNFVRIVELSGRGRGGREAKKLVFVGALKL